MNNLIYFIIVIFIYIYIYISREPVLVREDRSFVQFYKEVKYRAFALLYLLFFVFLFGSQTTFEDVFPEDERLNLWFLGVKEAK